MSVKCNACGEEWPRDPALEVQCPTCNAKVGRRCRRPSEHQVFGGGMHPDRDRLAMKMGFLKLCPKGPTALGLKTKEIQESLF
jgi:DNA-directed RNA polymerase subunit RPC12/RpoP